MSAEKRWHEDTLQKNADPSVPEAILTWMNGLRSQKGAALFPDLGSRDSEPTQLAPDRASNDSETAAALLRAIQGTEIAARLKGKSPPGNGHRPAPPLAEPRGAASHGLEPGAGGPSATMSMLLRAMKDTEIAAFLEAFVAPAKGANDSAGPDQPAEAAGADSEAVAESAPPAPKPLTELLRSMQDAETVAFLEAFVVPAKEANKEVAQARPAKAATPHPKFRPPAVSLPGPPAQSDPAPATPAPPPAAAEQPATGTHPETEGSVKGLRPQVVPERAAPSPRARTVKAVRKHISKDRILGQVNRKLSSLASRVGLTPERLDWAESQLETRFEKWFEPPDPRRRSRRLPKPPVLAFYWPSHDQRACEVVDISLGGLHLITEDRWPEGSIVSLALQRTDRVKGTPDSWMAVDFRVVRLCEGSLAGAFIPSPPDLRYTAAGRAENCADRKTLNRFVQQLVPPDQM